MLFSDDGVHMVEDEGCACVDGFEAAGQLAPEHIVRGVVVALEVSGWHIVEQRVVCMSAFHLGLPEMMVRVDETGRDDFVGAVKGFGVGWCCEICSDLVDFVVYDEDVGVSEGGDGLIFVVIEDCPVAEEKA